MAEILMNFQSGVLSAAPGSGGTTLTSGNFAFLPAIVAPQTMRIALDPDGSAGAPEIVLVTAHTASATSLTVVRGQETAFGAGAARAHAIDTVWRHVLTRASIIELTVPAATVSATAAATPDPGYVFIDGSTLVNGQVLYPAAWARIPATWQSAPNIILPDWRGKILIADDAAALYALGGSAGAMSKTIAQANLPAVGITVDPPSTAVAITDPGHVHASTPLANFFNAAGSTTFTPGAGANAALYGSQTPNTASAVTGISATVDIAPFTSGNLGSGTALDVTPAVGVVNYQLKVH